MQWLLSTIAKQGEKHPHFTFSNIIYVCTFNHFHREKANLAITLCNDKEEIMAQATFLDYPNWKVANQDDWLSLLQELDNEIPCTVSNHAQCL